jgi:hypothetical protein
VIIALGIALLVGSAEAAPRVVVITADAQPAEMEIARAELEAAQLDGRVMTQLELPLAGAVALLDTARRDAAGALEKARAAFVRTDYAGCRQIADALPATWGGDPRVARGLAQLSLIAAQCGDKQGYERAAAREAHLELDPARWSPDVRAAYERAVTARDGGAHGMLFVGSEPAGAGIWLDGEPAGHTPVRLRTTAGEHAVLLLADGSVPVGRTIEVHADKLTTLVAPLVPLAGNERLGALRLAVEAGEDPGGPTLADAARRLDADAVAVVRATGPEIVRAVVAGPGVGWAAFEQRGQRLGALRRVVADLGRHVRGECGLVHTPPERAHAGGTLELSAQAGACLAKVRAAHRLTGGNWTADAAALANGTAHLQLTLPSSDHATVLEYFLAGETARGNVAAQAGTQTAPLRIPVDADVPLGRPWYKKWWVWTLAGVAVAGAGVAIYVATAPGTDARLGGP